MSAAYVKTLDDYTLHASAYSTIASYSVPAGSYVVSFTAKLANNAAPDGAPVNCVLHIGDASANGYVGPLQAFATGEISNSTLSITNAATLATSGDISIECQDNAGNAADSVDFTDLELVATQVGSLNQE
jgi:hypothetical protein